MKKYLLLALSSIISQLSSSQNVGIGTTTPSAPFHIKSATAVEMVRIEGLNPYISFFNGSTYSGYLWYNTNRMELGTPLGSGQPVVIAPGLVATGYFTTAGRLGLGVASPTEKLDVNGNINLSGLLKVDGASGAPGQVLTSNGTSSPTWQSSNPNNGFHTENAVPQLFTSLAASNTKVEFNSIVFNDGANFTSGTDAFTAPAMEFTILMLK